MYVVWAMSGESRLAWNSWSERLAWGSIGRLLSTSSRVYVPPDAPISVNDSWRRDERRSRSDRTASRRCDFSSGRSWSVRVSMRWFVHFLDSLVGADGF